MLVLVCNKNSSSLFPLRETPCDPVVDLPRSLHTSSESVTYLALTAARTAR